MAGSTDYSLNFLFKTFGKEDIARVVSEIRNAGIEARRAKDESTNWLKQMDTFAKSAGVSVKELNAQIRENAREQQAAARETEKLARVQAAHNAMVAATVAGEARREAANRARQLAEFDRFFGTGSGGSGGGGGGAGTSLFGRVGGRVLGAEVLGRGLGVPGGGFIGSQLAYGSGISGGAALGLGAAAAGVVGAYATAKAIDETTKYAQEQYNLAKQMGLTVEQTQILGKVSEISGVQVTGLFNTVKRLNEQLLEGGPASAKVQESLKQLGLDSGIAFERPEEQLQMLLRGLRSVSDESERGRIIVRLLGESGRELLPLVDSFERLSQTAKQGILSKEEIENLKNYREEVKQLGLAWDDMVHKLGTIAIGVVKFTVSTGKELFSNPLKVALDAGSTRGPGGFGLPEPDAPPPITGGIYGTVGPNIRSGFALSQSQQVSAGVARLRSQGLDPVESARQDVNDYKQLENSAIAAYKESGNPSDYAAAQGYANQRAASERKLTYQEKLRGEQRSFAALPDTGDLTPDELASEGKRLRTSYGLLTPGNTPGYSGRVQAIRVAQTQVGEARMQDMSNRELDHIISVVEHEYRQGESRDRANETRMGRETSEYVRSQGFETRGEETLGLARAGADDTAAGGFSRYGMSPRAIAASIKLREDANTNRVGAVRGTALGENIDTLNTAMNAAAHTPGEEARRQYEIYKAELDQKNLDLASLQIETNTKLVASGNKFNEALDQMAEKVRGDFAGGFAGIILGAQHGGGRGALGALRGFAEQQEGTILRNIGGQIWDRGGKKAAQQLGIHLPDWLTQGTLLERNTDAMKVDINAIRKLLEEWKNNGSGPNVGGGSGVTVGGSGGGGIPRAAGSGGAGIGAGLSALGLGGVFSGSDSNNSMIFHGFPSSGASAGGSYQPLAVKNILADVAGGLLAYQGIRDLTSGVGGGKRIAGGISEVAGGAALIDPEPVSKAILAGVAIASGLVSSLFGDPRAIRSAEVSKQIFTSQYQAPLAQNITQSSNGSYSDLDVNGNYRQTNFSPYPILSNPYSDVPRRTDVPGHGISSFGGLQTTPSAGVYPTNSRTVGGNTYHVTIQSIDSKSFIDHADDVVSAFHRGINNQNHPVINDLAGKMGIRH